MVTLPPGRVLLGEEDVTESIRSVDVTQASKFIADSPSVRRRLMVWQRAFAEQHDVVTEGRDQGTLVFPTAFRKYYLTASDEERARRRLADYWPGARMPASSRCSLTSAGETPAMPPARLRR